MVCRPEVLDRVLVLGRVATSDVTALRTHPQLQPDVTQSQAVLAIRPGGVYVANLNDVRARHWFFGWVHDEWNMSTSRCPVESIDSMGVMPRVDSRPLSAIDVVHTIHDDEVARIARLAL